MSHIRPIQRTPAPAEIVPLESAILIVYTILFRNAPRVDDVIAILANFYSKT